MKKKTVRQYVLNLVLSAMFLALGIVLPFFTGQIPQVGGMLLPMHLPVLLCGLICGWQYGGVVGFVLPLMRSAMFGMPPFLTAVAMAFELAAYGAIAGFLYQRSRWQCLLSLYRALLIAMVGGRVVCGAWCGSRSPAWPERPLPGSCLWRGRFSMLCPALCSSWCSFPR